MKSCKQNKTVQRACACGCDELISGFVRGKPKRFVSGHNLKLTPRLAPRYGSQLTIFHAIRCARISLANKRRFADGGVHPMLGKCHTAVSRQKMTQSRMGKPCPQNIERNKRAVGEKAYHWKGGTTDPDKAERGRFKRQLLKLVLKRDGYSCVLCGKCGELHVDHIKSWRDYPELRFDENNCRTLCVGCHYEATYGRPKPTDIKTWGRNFIAQPNREVQP